MGLLFNVLISMCFLMALMMLPAFSMVFLWHEVNVQADALPIPIPIPIPIPCQVIVKGNARILILI